MPNFTIRRRKKTQSQPRPPPPQVEKKVDEMEESFSEESEEELIEKAMNDMKIQPRPQKQTQNLEWYQKQPQTPVAGHPQYEKQPTVARQVRFQPSNQQNSWSKPSIHDPYTRKPTMRGGKYTRRQGRGGARLRFRSHYGTGGEYMDTRTKSSLLLSHCFG